MHPFIHDSSLPALPVPSLEQSCHGLKQFTRPLLGSASWNQTCGTLDAFLRDGSGQKLQELLLKWQGDLPENSSWLRPLWDDAYLSFRGALPFDLAYSFQFDTLRWGAETLAHLMCGLTRQILLLGAGRLAPEVSGKGAPYSMDTLRSMLYTRIPGPGRDTLRLCPATAPVKAAVAANGHWFLLSLTDLQGRAATPAQIGQALSLIQARARELGEGPGLGVMTAAERADVLQMREMLLTHRLNRLSLDRLEGAHFAVCLDPPQPPQTPPTANIVCGDARNRWYDKSLQIITDGSHLGVNLEHAGCDAGIWLYFFGRAHECMSEPLPEPSAEALPVEHLEWAVPEAARPVFKEAADNYARKAAALSFCQRRIPALSKAIAKAHAFSPDALVHLLYQIADRALTGRFRSVYEAVSTRGFYQGRTECGRPCTEESAAFVEAYLGGSEDPSALAGLLRAAQQAHRAMLRRCQAGQGPERHLAGLRAMFDLYQGTGHAPSQLPAIFEDAGFLTLSHNALSTSSSTAPYLSFFSYCPVVGDGLGIGYGVKDDALHVAISSYQHGNCTAFADAMEEHAPAVLSLLEATGIKPVPV